MNALNVSLLRVVACALVAVAVTLASSYAFVASTAVVHTASAPTHGTGTASIRLALARPAGADATGLLQ